MSAELLPLALGIVLAQIAPGPNMLVVASVALGSGRLAGMVTALGVATGVLIWSILFLAGAGALVEAAPWLIILFKIGGGGYLLYLGARALRAALGPSRAVSTEKNRVTVRRAYLLGLLVVLTNPKAVMMWIAVAAFVVSQTLGPAATAAVGLGAALSATVIYGVYGVIFSSGPVGRGYARFWRWIEGGFGLLFGATGAMLCLQGLREARAQW